MTEKTRYGLDNPHPLSQLKTELVWDGKYDEYGNRRAVDIAGCAMPLQKIETIDEPRSRAAADGNLEMFEKEKKRRDDFRNRLIWGDNKLVIASLLAEFKGKVDLIYIDPPFDVGADFTMNVPIGDEKETVAKDQSTLEMVAYRDMWGKGTDSYLHMMFERLSLMKELLSETGNICVHCDWHASHHLKIVLGEIFGVENFRNEIVWWYYNKMQGNVGRFAANHDVILWFSKTASFHFESIREQREEPKQQQKRVWDKETQSLKQAVDEAGNLIYYTETERTLDDVWRIPYLMPADLTENLRYNTQKPIELVGRILDALSPADALIFDGFCGSGTTLAAADGLRARRIGEKKEFYFASPRRWIGSDLGRFSIHTSRKRLIELQRTLHDEGKSYRAFDVYNLGRYERQWWQVERLKGADEEHRKVVLGFYKAEVLPGAGAYLHGRKGRAFVHVDGIDSILTRDEVRTVAKAAREAGAKEVHCLAWEFEMDLRLVCHELEASEGVQIKLIPIPREIMEKNRTSPPPFLEVAVLEAEPVYRPEKGKTTVDIKLTKFLPSLAEVPSKELEALKERALKSGFDFIDFWAIDFNWHEDKPFEHHWQDYRTRKDRSLKTVSDSGFDKYPKPGKYTACVKVVDVFGCDTSITVEVKV
jgi:adenine-specific DNA-methyltransferase